MSNSTENQQNFEFLSRDVKLGYGVVNLALAVFTTISNILVIYVVCRSHALRTRSSILLASLAVSDLLVGILLDPLTSLMLLSSAAQNMTIVNTIRRFISVLSVGASIGSIAAISFDRYVHLSKTMNYLDVMTKWKIAILLCASWTMPLLIPAFRVITQDEVIYSALIVGYCTICLTITCASYIFIVYIVRRKEREMKSKADLCKQISNSVRAARAIALIIICFLLMLLPIMLYNFLLSVGGFGYNSGLEWFYKEKRDNIYVFCMTAVQANSAVNPVIYFLRAPGFKEAFKKIVRRGLPSISRSSYEFGS